MVFSLSQMPFRLLFSRESILACISARIRTWECQKAKPANSLTVLGRMDQLPQIVVERVFCCLSFSEVEMEISITLHRNPRLLHRQVVNKLTAAEHDWVFW